MKQSWPKPKKHDKEKPAISKKGGNPGVDPFTKKKEPVKTDKTYFEKHTIGVLTIPEINVHLPIFDETNTVLLEKGASLLEGTSYPTGEKVHTPLFLVIGDCLKQSCSLTCQN